MNSKIQVLNKLKILRVMNGDLTQQELADKLQCSRQTIHSIESGKFLPSVELALRLAKVFGVSVESIFFIKDETQESDL